MLGDSLDRVGPKSVVVILFPFFEEGSPFSSIPFPPIEREMADGLKIQVGRKVERKRQRLAAPLISGLCGVNGTASPVISSIYAEEEAPDASAESIVEPPDQASGSAADPSELHVDVANFISFRSKVVSRLHAEIWYEDGIVQFRDSGSSSGTFLNRLRLSSSNKPSRAYALETGDIIQFGVDYQGRQEDIFKCVTARVVIRQKQAPGNQLEFNRGLEVLSKSFHTSNCVAEASNPCCSVDCCICLSTLGPQSALFLSPCSHTFHFKCILPLLYGGVMFHCPLCRGWFNLWKNVPASESPVRGTPKPLVHESVDTPLMSIAADSDDGNLSEGAQPRGPLLVRNSTQSFETSDTLNRQSDNISTLNRPSNSEQPAVQQDLRASQELSLLDGLRTPEQLQLEHATDDSSVCLISQSPLLEPSLPSCASNAMESPLTSALSDSSAIATQSVRSESESSSSSSSSSDTSSSNMTSPGNSKLYLDASEEFAKSDDSSPTIKKILVKIRSRMSLRKWHYPPPSTSTDETS